MSDSRVCFDSAVASPQPPAVMNTNWVKKFGLQRKKSLENWIREEKEEKTLGQVNLNIKIEIQEHLNGKSKATHVMMSETLEEKAQVNQWFSQLLLATFHN